MPMSFSIQFLQLTSESTPSAQQHNFNTKQLFFFCFLLLLFLIETIIMEISSDGEEKQSTKSVAKTNSFCDYLLK